MSRFINALADLIYGHRAITLALFTLIYTL